MNHSDMQPDCWKYLLPGGFEVLAGKTDADNDLFLGTLDNLYPKPSLQGFGRQYNVGL